MLKCRMSPGEIQTYSAEIKLTMDAKAGKGRSTQNGSMQMTLNLGFMLKCISAEENQFTCEARFYSPAAEASVTSGGQSIRMVMDGSGIKTYSGGKILKAMTWEEAAGPNMPNLSDLAKLRMRCVFGSDGSLLDILNKSELEKEFPGFPFKDMMGQQVVFPSHPVDVGDSWKTTLDIDMGEGFQNATDLGEVSTELEYTLTKVGMFKDVKAAVINVKGYTLSGEDLGANLSQTTDGEIVVEIASGKIMAAKITVDQSLSGQMTGANVDMAAKGDIVLRYTGSQLPKGAIEQDLLDGLGTELLNALNELKVPIITRDKIKIGGQFYAEDDEIEVAGSKLGLVKYSDDVIYLRHENTGTVLRLVFNYKGQVRSITPIAIND